MDKSNRLLLFFLINLIFTFGSITGFILWSNNTTIVNYSYYTFCSIINMIFVLVGFCLYDKFGTDTTGDFSEGTFRSTNASGEGTVQERSCWNGNVFICISFVYTVIWIFAALTSTLEIQHCLDSGTMNCSGVIMSTIFGYLLFILWSLSFFITIIYR